MSFVQYCGLTASIALALASTAVEAQDTVPTDDGSAMDSPQQTGSPPPMDSPPETGSPPPTDSVPEQGDGGRFRFGVNAAAGLESVSFDGGSVSGPMVGADLRLGYQINNLLGLYAQTHLSFGSLSSDAAGATVSGATGTFAVSVLGEATISDLIFAGGGVGYGVLNNPSGFMLHARAGAYPLMSHDDDGVGRSGLMVGADLKVVFIEGATGLLIMAAVGYENF